MTAIDALRIVLALAGEMRPARSMRASTRRFTSAV